MNLVYVRNCIFRFYETQLLWNTVVSNYRFYREGLFWQCQTLKAHYFFCLFNARTKTKPVPKSLLGEILDSRYKKEIFFLLLFLFSQDLRWKNVFFYMKIFFSAFLLFCRSCLLGLYGPILLHLLGTTGKYSASCQNNTEN